MNRILRSVQGRSILLTSSALFMSRHQSIRGRSNTRMQSAIADSTVTDNPLLDQGGLPRFTKIDAVHVIPAMEKQLADFDEAFAALEEVLKNPQSGETWGKKR